MTTIGELCNRTVSIAHPHEPALEAARRMRDHHVGCLVVVDETGAGRVPIGVVTDRDLVMGLLTGSPDSIDQVEVCDVMTPKPIVAREEESLLDALGHMRAHGVRRVVVVDRAGMLEGIFAIDDILEHVADHLDRIVALIGRERTREESRTHPPV